jgi:co-chaperonin GroES (HSP10)
MVDADLETKYGPGCNTGMASGPHGDVTAPHLEPLESRAWDLNEGPRLPGTEYYGFEPVGDRLLVIEVPQTKVAKNGIILPDTVAHTHKVQRVLARSADVQDTRYEPGAEVLTTRYAGMQFDIGGNEVSLILVDDIAGLYHAPKEK